MHLHFIEKDLSSYSAWAILHVPVALSSIQKHGQRHYEHCESEGPQSILMVSALGMKQHRHKCTRKKVKENMLVLDEDSHACQIILKCPGSSSVFLLLIRHLRPWLLVIPLRELWIISTAYESPGLSWQPQTNPGSWERYHSSAVQWRVGCGSYHCFFMDPTASRTRIPSLPSQAWAIWPCEKEVPLTLHRWGSWPHFPPSGSGRSSTNNSLMLQTCILWSPSSCLTWQHLQPLQHFMNEETAKLICFWFSCSYGIISKSFTVLVLRTDLAFNLYFFFKVILSKLSLSVEEIESYESHSKSFLGSAVAFSMGNWQGLRCEWRQRKPVSSRSPVTERLLAHMSKRKCANLPSTANRVCLPETRKVWCILGI